MAIISATAKGRPTEQWDNKTWMRYENGVPYYAHLIPAGDDTNVEWKRELPPGLQQIKDVLDRGEYRKLSPLTNRDMVAHLSAPDKREIALKTLDEYAKEAYEHPYQGGDYGGTPLSQRDWEAAKREPGLTEGQRNLLGSSYGEYKGQRTEYKRKGEITPEDMARERAAEASRQAKPDQASEKPTAKAEPVSGTIAGVDVKGGKVLLKGENAWRDAEGFEVDGKPLDLQEIANRFNETWQVEGGESGAAKITIKRENVILADNSFINKRDFATLSKAYQEIGLKSGGAALEKAMKVDKATLASFRNKDGSYNVLDALLARRTPEVPEAVERLFSKEVLDQVQADNRARLTMGTGTPMGREKLGGVAFEKSSEGPTAPLSSEAVTAEGKYRPAEFKADKSTMALAGGVAIVGAPGSGGLSLVALGIVALGLSVQGAKVLREVVDSYQASTGRNATPDDVVLVDDKGNVSTLADRLRIQGVDLTKLGRIPALTPPKLDRQGETIKVTQPMESTPDIPVAKKMGPIPGFGTKGRDITALYLPTPAIRPEDITGEQAGVIQSKIASVEARDQLKQELDRVEWDKVLASAKPGADAIRANRIKTESQRLAHLLPSEVIYIEEQRKAIAAGASVRPRTTPEQKARYLEALAQQQEAFQRLAAGNPALRRHSRRMRRAYQAYLAKLQLLAEARASYVASLNPTPLTGKVSPAIASSVAAFMLSQQKGMPKLAPGQSLEQYLESATSTQAKTAALSKAMSQLQTQTKAESRTDAMTRAMTATRAATQSQIGTATRSNVAARSIPAAKVKELVRANEAVRTGELTETSPQPPLPSLDTKKKKLEDLTEEELKASVAWEQGELKRGAGNEPAGYLVPPPYTQKLFWHGKPPNGVILSPDTASAMRTIQKVNKGRLPPEITGSIGFARFTIKGREKPSISFTKGATAPRKIRIVNPYKKTSGKTALTPAQKEAIGPGPFKILKRHDDGDLTIQEKSGRAVLTTDGIKFREVKGRNRNSTIPRSERYGPLWHTKVAGGTILSRFPLSRRRRRRSR